MQSQALTLNSAEIRVSYLGRLLRDNDALPRFIRNTVGETIPGVETRRSVARRVPILVELPTFRRPSGKQVRATRREKSYGETRRASQTTLGNALFITSVPPFSFSVAQRRCIREKTVLENWRRPDNLDKIRARKS